MDSHPITDREVELYSKAGALARVAMGKTELRRGRGWGRKAQTWIADDDPLAWWCLTEGIVKIAKEYRK